MRRLRRTIELRGNPAGGDRIRPQAPDRPVGVQQGFLLPQGLLPELRDGGRRRTRQGHEPRRHRPASRALPRPAGTSAAAPRQAVEHPRRRHRRHRRRHHRTHPRHGRLHRGQGCGPHRYGRHFTEEWCGRHPSPDRRDTGGDFRRPHRQGPCRLGPRLRSGDQCHGRCARHGLAHPHHRGHQHP